MRKGACPDDAGACECEPVSSGRGARFQKTCLLESRAHDRPCLAVPGLWRWLVRRGQATRLGPNAFARPGGVGIVTDEMLQLLADRDDVLIGVLGHELGHVQRRHGMRMMVQTTVLGAVATLLWGDISTVLAAAPALLGQSAYLREFEREADGDSVALLQANGLSPLVMVELFERLKKQRETDASDQSEKSADAFDLGIALASHPADAERAQRFRDAAAR